MSCDRIKRLLKKVRHDHQHRLHRLRVANYQSLIDSLSEPGQVFILDGESDGFAQMATDLQRQTGIDAIHVIRHGSQGALYLGSG